MLGMGGTVGRPTPTTWADHASATTLVTLGNLSVQLMRLDQSLIKCRKITKLYFARRVDQHA